MEGFYIVISSPIGPLWLCQTGEHLTRIAGTCPKDLEQYVHEKTPLLAEAERQLTEYFCGGRKDFSLPTAPQGTAFQQAVWAALCAIPYGEVRSYKQIAESIGRPKASRAVGQANHVNPLLIVQPCHRVVGANGSLTGFAYGTDAKQILLDLEKSNI